MGRVHIRNVEDAKDLRHEHKPEKTGFHKPNTQVGAAPEHGVTGQGMNGMEVDVDALRDIDKQLEQHQHELTRQLTRAARLTEYLNDGETPISGPMRRAFLDRADDQGGIQGTLQQYLDELSDVRLAISATLESYQNLDASAATLMRDPGVQ
jgi:hypothetical protein